MSSDRARISYDKGRQYDAVVSLQGRVAVEADANEASTIAREQLRKEALDFVGPAGTPDDGYAIQPATGSGGPFDVVVGPGTMYVGGVRAHAPEAITYSDQSDWLDYSDDPDWIDPGRPAGSEQGNELVILSLAEGDVGATEDPPLREIALGGPDTSGRIRLTQRIKRLATDADTCEAALADATRAWAAQGLLFDPATMRLGSPAELEVSFTTDAGPDPCGPEAPEGCEPDATGGYLGADNQFIRVQVTDWDVKSETGKLVWGFDGASFLYRVDVAGRVEGAAGPYQVVELRSRPPDDQHQPRTGQAVEILRSGVRLATDAFVASATGTVMTLASPYDPDTMRIQLPTALTAEQADPSQTPVLFLRVWEREVSFAARTAVALDALGGPTGLQVSVTPGAGLPIHIGDFWLFAVRPATPTIVYPQRYLEAPQPPEGPRLWACPLAVVSFAEGAVTVVEECRDPFDDLVELTRRRQGGCCDVLLRPADLEQHDLQEIVNRFTGHANVTICLMPGTYRLRRPLLLTAEHSRLTIEACHDGAVIEADPAAAAEFSDGLIVLDRADNVTLRGLRFHLPAAPFSVDRAQYATADVNGLGSVTKGMSVSIAIRPVHCARLTIEDCLFRYGIVSRALLGVGIFAQSECWGHRIERNRFLRDDDYLKEANAGSRLLIGYLLASSLLSDKRFVHALLEDASFRANSFSGLAAAVLVIAQTGVVEVEGNDVRDCFDGFHFSTLRLISSYHLLPRAEGPIRRASIAAGAAVAPQVAMFDPVVVASSVLALTHPLPMGIKLPRPVTLDPARAAIEERQTMSMLHDWQGPAEVKVVDRQAMTAAGADAPAIQPPAAAADPKGTVLEAPVAAAPEIGMSRAEVLRYRQVANRLSAVLVAATGGQVGLRLSLHVSDNDVQTIDAGARARVLAYQLPVAAALLASAGIGQPSELTMVGNRFRGTMEGVPTVTIAGVEHCAISGNVIRNEGHGYSLRILTGAPVQDEETIAVTGNAFQGPVRLPARPAGLPDWVSFNARSS